MIISSEAETGSGALDVYFLTQERATLFCPSGQRPPSYGQRHMSFGFFNGGGSWKYIQGR